MGDHLLVGPEELMVDAPDGMDEEIEIATNELEDERSMMFVEDDARYDRSTQATAILKVRLGLDHVMSVNRFDPRTIYAAARSQPAVGGVSANL